MIPSLLLVIGAALALVAFFSLRPARNGADDTATEPTAEARRLVRAVWVFGGRATAVEAEVWLDATEDGARLRFAIEDDDVGIVLLEATTHAAGATGTLWLGDNRGSLFGRPELSMLPIDTLNGGHPVPGLLCSFGFAHQGPVHRLRDAFLGFVEAPEVVRELRELIDGPARADAVIPWTLESATRYALRVVESSEGVSEAQLVGGAEIFCVLDGGERRVSVYNVFQNLPADSPEEGRRMLDDFVRNMLTPPAEPTGVGQVTLRVFPGPAPFKFQMPDGSEHVFASFALSDDLSAVFMHDTPSHMRSLHDDELDALLPRERAADVARANVLREVGKVHVRGEGPLFMLIAGGNYEAALVAIPSVWEALEPLLDGPPLVGIAARDLVYLTGDTGPERRERIKALCSDPGLAYAISDGVYRVHDRGLRLERVC